MRKSVVVSSVIACLCVPGIALAEASVNGSAIVGSAVQAKLDITVVVPAVLSLRVGTGGALNTVNTTIDSLVFTVPAANVGNGASVAAGATDGDLGNGAVTVRVYSNVGTNVSLNSYVRGPLTSVAGNTIPWSEITVNKAPHTAPTLNFNNNGIDHPAFNPAVSGGDGLAATNLPAVDQLVRYEGMWTYV